MAYQVRQVIAENYERKFDELMTELGKRGIDMKRSSVSSIHINTIRLLELIVNEGLEVRNSAGQVVVSSVEPD